MSEQSIAGLIAELRATATCQRNCMGRCDRCPMDVAESVISELQSLSTDLAVAKGALRNHVINHWYNAAGGGSAPHKCTCDECNGEWLPNEPEKHVGDCAAALQPKVETP